MPNESIPIHGNVPPTDVPDQPGQWAIYNDPDNGERRIIFGCPRRPGASCAVPFSPATLPNGATWHWDGNTTEPTITPSVNCVGGCGWHGWITKGAPTNA